MSANLLNSVEIVKYELTTSEKLIMPLSSLEKIISPHFYGIRIALVELIERAKSFGLSEVDAKNAQEALGHNEFEVALNTVLVQLNEYSIGIDEPFITSAQELCASMKISWDEYAYVCELLNK